MVVGVILLLLFGCVQQSGNVFMAYTVSGCSGEEQAGISVENAGDVVYIKQVEDYVCCANITLTMNATDKTIRIYEENIGEMCRCICPFKAEIYLYNATSYENVEIYGIKFKDVYGYELMYNYSLAEKNKTENKTCKDMCGDGICQEVVCMAVGCPCPETPETCPQDCGTTTIPNPASKYCQEKGYKSEIRTDETGGEYGVCILPDGTECEEWAFYRRECPYEFSGCRTDNDCVHIPSCCHQESMECIPKSEIKKYPDCKGVACTLECRQCTECVCKNGKCETIPLPIDVCCG